MRVKFKPCKIYLKCARTFCNNHIQIFNRTFLKLEYLTASNIFFITLHRNVFNLTGHSVSRSTCILLGFFLVHFSNGKMFISGKISNYHIKKQQQKGVSLTTSKNNGEKYFFHNQSTFFPFQTLLTPTLVFIFSTL